MDQTTKDILLAIFAAQGLTDIEPTPEAVETLRGFGDARFDAGWWKGMDY